MTFLKSACNSTGDKLHQSERNPDGVPKEVVDGLRDGTANHRSQSLVKRCLEELSMCSLLGIEIR
jgi:hypothetical protein